MNKLPLLWSQKVYYRVHISPPQDPTLSHMNPVHIFPPDKIHFNTILLSGLYF